MGAQKKVHTRAALVQRQNYVTSPWPAGPYMWEGYITASLGGRKEKGGGQ